MEGIVPDGKHLVSQSHSIAEIAPDGLVKEVRFSTLRVNVRVGTEERHERAGLVPSDQKLWGGVTKETTDVR